VSETSHFFSCVLCGEDVHSSKPSPDIFLEAIARMQILACDTAVVEDSISGIRAAKAAGVGLVIAIAREETARKLLHIGADRVVHDLAELPYVLS
jgi:beta-phosphoglucomutase-like phosphatase (HAD superfamily)